MVGASAGTMKEMAAGRAGSTALVVLPAALLVYFSFNSGGLFAVTAAFGAVLLLVAGAVALAFLPLAMPSRFALAGGACLAALCAWTLASQIWSGVASRALVAFDRDLLYLAALLLFALMPRRERTVRWALGAMLVAANTVALIALASRLLPSVIPTAQGLVSDRLSYPVTYWNGLAMVCGIAILLAVHHAADDRGPRSARIIGAGVLPAASVALLLTFSRGALAATLLGILVYILLCRPRGLPGMALAVAPTTAFALVEASGASLVHQGTPLTPAALSQAHDLALTVGLCSVAAMVARIATLPLDGWFAAHVPVGRFRPAARIVLGGAIAALVVFLVAGGVGFVHRQVHHFVDETHTRSNGSGTDRLLGVGNDGRLPLWQVALRGLRQEPVLGTGAGTYQERWQATRRAGPERDFAYSLYVETSGELGIVGAALLVAALLTLLVGLVLRVRGPDRATAGVIFALFLAWAFHAGFDIDWQIPAVTLPVFALAGLGLAGRPRGSTEPSDPGGRGMPWRLAGASACALLALLPAMVAVAQFESTRAVDALSGGRCAEATNAARSSISALDAGPQPYEVLAMCAARSSRYGAAVDFARDAVRRDQDFAGPHLALALVLAAAGRSPLKEMQRATDLHPRAGANFTGGGLAFRKAKPSQWPAMARRLPFAIE